MKTAFLFPGQGAQYVGMAEEFYRSDADCRAFIDRADEALDFDLKGVLFSENNIIHKTEFTQAAVLAAELCILLAVRKTGIEPDCTAGLSLGEYAALVTAGAIDPFDALRLVRQRGILMEHAVPAGRGGMAAVIGLDADTVGGVCDAVNASGGTVVCANYNCPGQIVISGLTDSVERAAALLREAGAKLVTMLTVSGPFHSPLLQDAGERLGETLKTIKLLKPHIPYIANVTAAEVHRESEIASLLQRQVYSPVRWEETMRKLIERGVTRFIEIGPGKTIAGFFKRIDRMLPVVSVETPGDIEKIAPTEAKEERYVG